MSAAATIHDLFATIDARRWEHLQLHFSSEVIYERPGYEPIHGLDELFDFYSRVRVVAAGEHTINQIVGTSQYAACWGSFRGRSHEGRELFERFADVYVLRNGLIVHRTTYFFRPAI
jgi:uncharacterized protein